MIEDIFNYMKIPSNIEYMLEHNHSIYNTLNSWSPFTLFIAGVTYPRRVFDSVVQCVNSQTEDIKLDPVSYDVIV